MSCSKRLPAAAVIGLTLGAAWLRAAAASTPSFDAVVSQAPATSVIVPSASSAAALSGHQVSSRKTATAKAAAVMASPPAQSPAPAASAANGESAGSSSAASTPLASDGTHLTLGEIDRLARNRVASSLRGAEGASQPVAVTAPVKPAAALPPVRPGPSTLVPGYAPRARTEPVSFFGAYTDSGGQHVLYQYNDAVYDARVGEKLLNGWTARAVTGQVVTVAQGRHTWSVAMKGDAVTPAPVATPGMVSGGAPLLGDLSRPLPPAMLASPAN
ncbi:hypothetical protein [Paraburkholderia acidisoli]|uniref:Type IV pilus biogenesis protein PilP n=1 Tax=Paraburkholderia acidisoli TaxID=2571748 RepID=A0A7Z2GSJ6_9BURK|nr:hypothetical protein [Paraburkholderia acidisoli]QGZ66970.1 hypothetical protein FAZ98_34615 [Paraburkholderia acidisoli]